MNWKENGLHNFLHLKPVKIYAACLHSSSLYWKHLYRHFIWHVVVQRLMKTHRVVEIEVGINSGLQIFHCFVAFKIDVNWLP